MIAKSFCFALVVALATADLSIRSRLIQEKLFGPGPQLAVELKGLNIPGVPFFPNLQDLFDGAQEFIDVFDCQETRDALKEALDGNYDPARSLLDNGKFDPVYNALGVHPDTESVIDAAQTWLSHDIIRNIATSISNGRSFIRALLAFASNPETSAAFSDLVANRDIVAFINTLNQIFTEELENSGDENSDGSGDDNSDGSDGSDDGDNTDTPMCCTAYISSCVSCSQGISEEEFCSNCRQTESSDEACMTCPVLTQCQQLSQQSTNGMLGAHRPQCEEDGSFSARQCRGSTGYCWCVDFDGKEIAGTMQPPTSQVVLDCEQSRLDSMSECELHAYNSPPMIGTFRPNCLEDGSYNPLQCQGSTGYCWCVNEHGRMLDGTSTPPGQGRLNCVFTYDCTTMDNEEWTEEKTNWCCSNEMLGCPEEDTQEIKDDKSRSYTKAVVVSCFGVLSVAGVFVVLASRRYVQRQPRSTVKTVDAVEA